MHWREWIPETLATLRKGNDYTLAELAEKTGLSLSYISDIEHARAIPTLDTLDKILQAYGLTITLSCFDGDYIPPGYVFTSRDKLKELAALVAELTPKE